MERKLVLITVIVILLTSLLGVTVRVEKVQASGTIYIRADGSVDPPTAPITTADNVTYTLTGNCNESIIIERNNTVLDGGDYNVSGAGAGGGLTLSTVSNVTIVNLSIRDFYSGIYLDHAFNNTISRVYLDNLGIGVYFYYSSFNTLSESSIIDHNTNGLYFYAASFNGIFDCSIAYNYHGANLQNYPNQPSQNNTFSGNRIANNYYGLYLHVSPNNQILMNNITNNTYGLYVYASSNNNTIAWNKVTGNDHGITLYNSFANKLRNNNLTQNTLEVYGDDQLTYFIHDIDSSNNANGRPVYYWVNKQNIVVPSNAGHVVLVNSSNVTVEGINGSVQLAYTNQSRIINCNITGNYNGVYLRRSNNNIISGNNVTNTFYGVLVQRSSNNNTVSHNRMEDNEYAIYLSEWIRDCTVHGNKIKDNAHGVRLFIVSFTAISENTIVNNTWWGIELNWESDFNSVNGNIITSNYWGLAISGLSDHNTIFGNLFSDNFYGQSVYRSWNNEIYHNNFVNNTISCWIHPAVPITNTWDNGFPKGGNYWSDYTGNDIYCGPYQNETGTDGIGDTPYVLDEGNTDNYPVMAPWTGYYSFVTSFELHEVGRSNWTMTETITVSNYTLQNVSISEDLTGLLNLSLTGFRIETGAFANQGTIRGNWTAKAGGFNFSGNVDMFEAFDASSECRVLKGAVSGDFEGTAEGTISESTPESGVYNKFFGIWRLNSITSGVTSATIMLNGTITEQNDHSLPATELATSQAILIGNATGYYTGPLTVVNTHVRVDDEVASCHNEGFSTMSYASEEGSGEGWTTDNATAPGFIESTGMFLEPLSGIVHSARNETGAVTTMMGTVARILDYDVELPLPPDLGFKVWGPDRISPGETITYVIDYWNNGLTAAENATLDVWPTCFSRLISASPDSAYDDTNYKLTWTLSIPGKSHGEKRVRVETVWGLPAENVFTSAAFYSSPEELSAPDRFRRAYDATLDWRRQWEVAHNILQGVDIASTVLLIPVPHLSYNIGLALKAIENMAPAMTMIKLKTWVMNQWLDADFQSVEWGFWSDVKIYLQPFETWDDVPSTEEFLAAIEEIAIRHGYKPERMGASSRVTTAADPNVKYGPPLCVSRGQRLNYTVEYENEGEGTAFGVYFTDTLHETLNASTLEIGPVKSTANHSVIADPGTYDSETRTITWFVGEVGPGEGGYASFNVSVSEDAVVSTEITNVATVYFPSVPEATPTNAIVNLVAYDHDIAISCIAPSKISVGQSQLLPLTVTVENQGVNVETFNLTVFANGTFVQTESVTLSSGNHTTIGFSWDTNGFSKGWYTITAYATPVTGETDMEDNNLTTSMVVLVTLSGDVDLDRDVDIFDIVQMCNAYGTTQSDPDYDLYSDLDCDGDIDIFDIVAACNHYGESW